jgi:Large polyvalent protein associated domain 38
LPWLNGGTVYNAFGQQIEVPKGATGIWVAIPKPFDMALIPNAAERAFEALYLKDPTAAKRWAKGALTITSPPNPLSDIPLLKNIAEIRSGHDFFTNQPIVPDYLKGLEPEHQYTARTPEITKPIARAMNAVLPSWMSKPWSPLEVEHLIAGFTSTWGRDLMALFDVAAGKEKGWQDWPFTRRYMREVTRGSVSNLAYWDLISNGNGRLENAAKSHKMFLENNKPIEAADHFAKLDAAQKAYVALKNGDHFSADDKKLHPLIRAQEAMQALTGLRRQVANNNVVSAFADREDIKLTGSQQKMLEQELAMLSMIEARNALIVAKEPGWEQKQVVKPDATYDVIRQISPEIADELATRYAQRKIYKFDAAAQAWPQVLAQMRSEGTDTSLAEYRSDVRSAGYEMDGYRRRKAKLPRASISAEEMMRAPQ